MNSVFRAKTELCCSSAMMNRSRKLNWTAEIAASRSLMALALLPYDDAAGIFFSALEKSSCFLRNVGKRGEDTAALRNGRRRRGNAADRKREQSLKWRRVRWMRLKNIARRGAFRSSHDCALKLHWRAWLLWLCSGG